MSANPDPSKHPNASSMDALASGFNALSPRKLSRLLLDAARPLYLLDSQGRIRFANQALASVLKTTEQILVGLDCQRVVAGDEHLYPTLAGLLAIPEQARTTQISFDPLGRVNDASTEPWTGRLVIPLESQDGRRDILCVWLRDDDPLVMHASLNVEWLSRAETHTALIEARRSFSRMEGLYSLIGISPNAQLARRQAHAAIASDMPVCVYGPVGSGKATLARAIYHQRRKRERRLTGSGNLLPIDCRLMDRSLMQESLELATENESTHRSEPDNESTALLLCGIDQLANEALPPLATFLDRYPTTSILATSRTEDLFRQRSESVWQSMVAHIHVMTIRLEPLSNRIEDIVPLAESILEEIRLASTGKVHRYLSSTALAWLQAYPWPNDLRELRQTIHDACMKSTTSPIEPKHFSLAIRTFPSHVLKPDPLPSVNLDQMLEDFERNVLQNAIEAFPRNRAAAARHLGISRTRFLRRLAQLGLEASSPASEAPESVHAHEETIQAQDIPIFEEIHDDPEQ
jgi:transcriptional regulator with PAS, ATPase and Fis domain